MTFSKNLLLGISTFALMSSAMASDMPAPTLYSTGPEIYLFDGNSVDNKKEQLKNNSEGRFSSFGKDREKIAKAVDFLFSIPDNEVCSILMDASNDLKIEVIQDEGDVAFYKYSDEKKITIPSKKIDGMKTDSDILCFTPLLLHEILHNVQDRQGSVNLGTTMPLHDTVLFEKFSEAEAKATEVFVLFKLYEALKFNPKEMEQAEQENKSDSASQWESFHSAYFLDYVKTYRQQYKQNINRGMSDETASRKAHLSTRADQIKKTLNGKYPFWTQYYNDQSQNNILETSNNQKTAFPQKGNQELKKYLLKKIHLKYGLTEQDLMPREGSSLKKELKKLEIANQMYGNLTSTDKKRCSLRDVLNAVNQGKTTNTLPKTVNFASTSGR